MTCEIVSASNVAGNCACGNKLEPPHLYNGALRCKTCCPEHKPQEFPEYDGEPVTVQGEQEGLF